jgi:hypothetical protein
MVMQSPVLVFERALSGRLSNLVDRVEMGENGC